MTPYSNKRSLVRAGVVLIDHTGITCWSASSKDIFTVIVEWEMINILRTLIAFQAWDTLGACQELRVLAVSGLVVTIVSKLKAKVGASFDVIGLESDS
jgi:hypothetical protein